MQLSIVIPTLNEEAYLPRTLHTLTERAAQPDQLDTIVVDAGSSDATVAFAKKAGVRVFVCPDFRYQKYCSLNFGLEQAVAPVVLWLDADSLVPPRFDQAIQDAMQDPQVVGGAFEFALDEHGWPYNLITRANRLRYRLSPIYHGDQGLFCRKATANTIGGYPYEPLMEAAHFSRVLRKQGTLQLIRQPMITSARRFREGGVWRVMWFDVRMWIRFILGLPVAAFAKKYWKGAQSFPARRSPDERRRD
jgi:rSAM/selenodomain-associated transferase 2